MESIVLAVVYAVAVSSSVPPGLELGGGAQVPEAARGVLLPGRGVVELGAGCAAVVGLEAGHLDLVRGTARVVAEDEVVLRTPAALVVVRQGRALVAAAGEGSTACAIDGEVVVVPGASGRRVPAAELETGPPAGERLLSGGACVRVDRAGALASTPTRSRGGAEIGRAAEPAPPEPPLPELSADVSADIDEVEAAVAADVDRGVRQEAAACGCSEGGGGGGTLDHGAVLPPAAVPEPPEPGLLRIRVSLPERTGRR